MKDINNTIDLMDPIDINLFIYLLKMKDINNKISLMDPIDIYLFIYLFT